MAIVTFSIIFKPVDGDVIIIMIITIFVIIMVIMIIIMVMAIVTVSIIFKPVDGDTANANPVRLSAVDTLQKYVNLKYKITHFTKKTYIYNAKHITKISI